VTDSGVDNGPFETDWNRFDHWDLLLPPNRPGAEVLRRTESIIRRHGRVESAAVLGSTPEHLDLLARLRIPRIFCLEANLEFHRKVIAARRFPGVETVIEGDWLASLAEFVGSFDVVISDFTLGNVPHESQGDLLSLVARSLAPDGLFIDRVLTYRQPCYDYDRLIKHFEQLPANLATVNDFNAMWVFCGARVEQDQIIDATKTYEWSATEFDNPAIHWLLRQCQLITPHGAVWHYGRPWKTVRLTYGRSLEILSESAEPRSSAYHGWAFLIESRARRNMDIGDTHESRSGRLTSRLRDR
jgi:SAM-dependent methyltransferase